LKILVVDDNPSITKMLDKFLTIKGHDCTVSQDGRNAFEVMKKEKFDVVLLDLAMPNFSGYDIIDALEKTKKISEQNIIILTASAVSQNQMNLLLKRGVKACLKKPVSPEILLKIISSPN
jgi:two-component system, OmpR family, response regulator